MRIKPPLIVVVGLAGALASALVGALPGGLPLVPQIACAGEAEQLAGLLDRLGLEDLRIHLLERQLPQAATPAARLAIARRLADSYADRLVSTADDRALYDQLQQKIERLLAAEPSANTAALQVVLLQADYQRAEALVIAWLDDPGNAAPLHEALAILSRVAPELHKQRLALAADLEKLLQRLDATEGESARAALEPEVNRKQAMVSRTAYFTGWAYYYLGLARQNLAAAQGDFQAAKTAFCEVLGVDDDKDYAAVEVDALALESIWRSRAVIGLGLSEQALHHDRAAARCFGWLNHASVPPTIRDQAAYWQLQGLFNAGQMEAAVRFATTAVDALAGATSPGKNSLCIALVRTAWAGDGPKQAESAKLAELGIRGLARLRQYDLLDQLFQKYQRAVAEPDAGFYRTWLAGRAQFLAAEKSQAAEDYRVTLQTLRRALALPAAQQDLSAAGQCRYCLAWCEYRLDELATAAGEFHSAAHSLRETYPEMAEQAAWMQCVALQSLAARDKSHAAAAVSALQSFKLGYPGSAQIPKAELLIAKLQAGAAGAEASLQALAAIEPRDPNYAAAQFELAQLYFNHWSKVRTNGKQAAPLAAQALAAVDRFQAAAKGDDWERRLRASLLAIEIGSTSGASQSQLARYLASADSAAASAPPTHALLPEYHYRRLQRAQQQQDASAANAAAQWLADHAAGTPYELSALVLVAREADRAVDDASPAERPARLAAAARVYGRMALLLGDSPEAIAHVKNALAVNSRLAQYDADLGNWRQAAERLSKIVAAFPSDRKYLRRAGHAHFHAGQFQEALEDWRKLLAGLESGTSDWFEAKYYQLACLEHTDLPTARKVARQFALLFPKIEPPWRDKFAQLQQRLASE